MSTTDHSAGIPLDFALPNPAGPYTSKAFNPTLSLHDYITSSTPYADGRTDALPTIRAPSALPASAGGATTTAGAGAKQQGAFEEYGKGPFGGRDSVAIPLLCVLSLALSAGIVILIGWRRMEKQKRARAERKGARERDLRALRKSTLKIDV